MKTRMVKYKGKMVDRANFRGFVYNKFNEKKVAESWEERCLLIEGGWFDSLEEMAKFKESEENSAQKEKPKQKSKNKSKKGK